MHTKVQYFFLVAANALLTAAILVFAIGFFPHKAFLPGLASWNAESAASAVAPPFDRVIFMVVDALRSDFVYGPESRFNFTQSLIRSGAAVPFTGHASPPTITMPRVKAITTGSVPSFLDLVLNFAESDTTSTLATQDSWLAQMKVKATGKLVMYGDDTWLRLFPGFFDRSDGTTSFFVSDFTEVDHNVTRHVSPELTQSDWSTMVLHFLGLDHIGHKTGPRGPNMPAKQREMDAIVNDIYKAMETSAHLQNCLLVLLGDHGMNDAGNHGASSAGEVSTALTLISPKFVTAKGGMTSPVINATDFKYYDMVEQSDVAPTLAALLGFPVPRNSLGVFIPRMLDHLDNDQDRYKLLHANACQVQQIALATFLDVFASVDEECSPQSVGSEAERLACMWSMVEQTFKSGRFDSENVESAIAELYNFLYAAQDVLSSTASNYDLQKMQLGIGLAAGGSMFAIGLSATGIVTAGMPGLAFMLTIVMYGATMFASSYVEEEHQFWYWALGAWLTVLSCKEARYKNGSSKSGTMAAVIICLLFGIVRRWNQSGQKYAGQPDLVTEVVTKHPWLLWILVVASYAVVSYRLIRKAAKWTEKKQLAIMPVFVSISGFLFKLAFTAADAPELLEGAKVLNPLLGFVSKYPLLNLARVVFIGLAQMLACSIYYESPWTDRLHRQQFLETFHDLLTLFLITQTRTVNIPLILFYGIQFEMLGQLQLTSTVELTLTSLLFQYSSFFSFGGTNAISSVDLSNAYNGVGGYNVLAVGLLTFVSNWVGPVWWTSATGCLMSRKSARRKQKSDWFEHFAALTLFAAVSTLAVMLACMLLREHLFIWTVFSPKYLYTIAWVLVQHVVVNGLVGSLLLAV